MKKLRAEGLDVSNSHPAIEQDDVNKMYSSETLSNTSPQSLLNKVFFEIQLHFGRRGKEGLRELTKTSFTINKDADGKEYAKLSFNAKQKNHQGDRQEDVGVEQRMYAHPDDDKCPIYSLKKYINKLNPNCDAFFQRPLSHFTDDSSVWYSNKAIGHNQLGRMMKIISTQAKLSKEYSNHCIRATTVTVLNRNGMDPHQIRHITGHRRVESLAPYINQLSTSQKQSASNALHRYGKPENESHDIGPAPSSINSYTLDLNSQHQGQLFVNCQFSDNVTFNININKS